MAAEGTESHEVFVSVDERAHTRIWEIVVCTTMAVWSVLLFVVVRDAYGSFRVGRFDLGNMVQAVCEHRKRTVPRGHRGCYG